MRGVVDQDGDWLAIGGVDPDHPDLVIRKAVRVWAEHRAAGLVWPAPIAVDRAAALAAADKGRLHRAMCGHAHPGQAIRQAGDIWADHFGAALEPGLAQAGAGVRVRG